MNPRHLLSKLAFGPSPHDRAEVEHIGGEAWLARQLAPPADDGCERRIGVIRWRLKYKKPAPMPAAQSVPPPVPPAPGQKMAQAAAAAPPAGQNVAMIDVDEDREVATITRPIDDHWKAIVENEPQQERAFLRTAVAAATIVRAVHSPWQLREVMADFWHNHFNVNAVGDNTVAVALPAYDRDAIRAHALGNFREMLEAVATSAAMQVYLNNRSSRGGAANENYARELFELHTLGRPAYLNALYNRWRDVPGSAQGKPQGYIDQDVYEAARAFTGWTIEDGAGIGAGQRLPQTGRFKYVEGWHDNYQKRVLAAEFEPYQQPMADGRRVLDLVAAHPATARYVCAKLCTRLVSDKPSPALVEAVAKVFGDNAKANDQIAQTVRAIALSEEFARSGGAKIKRPLELVASFARAARIDLTATPGLLGELDGSGQRLFGWGPPTGHPDDGDYWLGSGALRRRWSLVLGLADDWWKSGTSAAADEIAHAPTAIAALQASHAVLLDGPASPAVASAILGGLHLDPGAPFAARKDAVPLARHLLAYVAMTPEFQRR
jgi:uncharacterized protein (DUF1800 family)